MAEVTSTLVGDGDEGEGGEREEESVPEEVVKVDELVEVYNQDEDFSMLQGVSEKMLRHNLAKLKDCTKIVISPEVQAEMKLVVAKNISAEKPWKQVRKEILQDYLPEETPVEINLHAKLKAMQEGELVLFGFAPALSEDEDTFYIFENEKVAKIASDIIKKLEAFDRKKALNIHYKYPREWYSFGSEKEVDANIPEPRTNVIDVEVQSIYPIRHDEKVFRQRLADDVRDGYAELLAGKKKYDNIYKTRLHKEVQSAPPKIRREQQTDPAFPTNIWSQYSFDVIEEIEPQTNLEKTESEIEAEIKAAEEAKAAAAEAEGVKKPLSKKIHTLLETLEFNEIDMYKNDYPVIAAEQVEKYEPPIVHESLCFTDINRCRNRVISCMDWHPEYSGVIVAAYAFNSICTFANDDPSSDPVRRSTFEHNPVILWSFNDILKPKLEMQSPREINCISFCPYNSDLLVGGCINGQVVIWDLKDRINAVETKEILTEDQQRYRNNMNDFLKWTKQEDYKRIVEPAAVSSTTLSHLARVTSIKWLGKHRQLAKTGMVTDYPEQTFEHFLTSSLDGTILIWDTHWVPTLEQLKKIRGVKKLALPDELKQSESEYKAIDKLYHAHFKLVLGRPITCFLMDEYPLLYEPKMPLTPLQMTDIRERTEHEAIAPLDPEPFKQNVIIGTLMGDIYNSKWEGFDFDQGTLLTVENLTGPAFGEIHDAPIISIERNPFIPDVFLSIGGNILALWHTGYMSSPLLWRRIKMRITHVKWSFNRPSVFFLSRADGALEIWDLSFRVDAACLVELLGGKMITCISQHRLTLAQEVLAVADYDANLRIVIIPKAFVEKLDNELENITTFFEHELNRKKNQDVWIASWFIQNKNLLDLRKKAADEARAELERIAREQKELEDIRQRKLEIEAAKRAIKEAKEQKFGLSDRLEKQWQALNMKRMEENLKQRINCKRKVVEEKVVVITEEEKLKAEQENAVKNIIVKGDEDYSIVCERLTPAEKFVTNRDDVANALVEEIFNYTPDYSSEELEFLENIAQYEFSDMGTFHDVLNKGKQRRIIINKELGGNVDLYKKYQAEHRDKFGAGDSIMVAKKMESVIISDSIGDSLIID